MTVRNALLLAALWFYFTDGAPQLFAARPGLDPAASQLGGELIAPGPARESLIKAVTGAGGKAVLLPGVHEITGPIDAWATGARLELLPGAILRPAASWAPGVEAADDPNNALIKVAAQWKPLTTLTAHCYGETRTITVASSDGLSVGDTIRLVSDPTRQEIAGDNPLGGTNRLSAARIDGIAGNVVTLDRPILIVHGKDSTVERATTALRDIHITGGGHLDASGRTFAVGVLLDGVLDARVDVKGSGFSRAAVCLQGGCNIASISFLHAGENNCGIFLRQSHAVEVVFNSTGTGPRFHRHGYIRPLLFTEWRCGKTRVRAGSYFANGTTGWQLKGAVGAIVEDGWTIADMDLTERAKRFDPNSSFLISGNKEGAAGFEVANGFPNGHPYAERSHGIHIGSGTIYDARHPSNEGNQGAAFIVDCFDIFLGDLSIINTGLSSSHAVGPQPTYKNGVILWDNQAVDMGRLHVHGIENPLVFLGGWNVGRCKGFYNSGVDGRTDTHQNIINGHESVAGGSYGYKVDFVIDEMMANPASTLIAPHRQSAHIPSPASWRGFKIGRIIVQGQGETRAEYEDVRFMHYGGGEPWAGGEVCQIRPFTRAFSPTNVNESTKTITMPGHPFANADYVTITSSGTAPAAAGWVVNRRPDSFQLSSSNVWARTVAIIPIVQGTGIHTIKGGVLAVDTPTDQNPATKGIIVNGRGLFRAETGQPSGGFIGVARKSGFARIADADAAQPGDCVEAVAGQRWLHVNNSTSNHFGTASESKGPAVVHDHSTAFRTMILR